VVCLVSHSSCFDVERLNIGGYFLTKLPNRIPRSFDDWEINLNEEGKQWFSELRLNKH
jgi:hypothetical protein